MAAAAVAEPSITVEEKDGVRIITEIKENDEGKIVKVVRKIRLIITKQMTNPAVAQRKKWSKFGAASISKPSFDDGITSLGDECVLKLQTDRDRKAEVQTKTLDDQLVADQSKKTAVSTISCRVCKGDHWTTKCPYKDTFQPLDEILDTVTDSNGSISGATIGPGASAAAIRDKYQPPALTSKPGSYVPPSMRGKPASGMAVPTRRQLEEETTVRIANLSDDTMEQDVRQLCERFGPLARIFLSKDKDTGRCKGFAFVCFRMKEHAARAIEKLNGYGFDNLILHVEWANREQNK